MIHRRRHLTYVLHHTHGLLSLANKLIFSLLDLSTSILTEVVEVATGGSLLAGLDRVKGQTGILHVLASLGGKHQVGVEGGVPSSQETRLDLAILGQTSLADLLLSKGILLQSGSERVLALDALRKCLRAGE